MFLISPQPIDVSHWHGLLGDPGSGALVCFEGRVRDHHEGRRVLGLDYEAYEKLALAEGNRILESIRWKFGLRQILCVHRTGPLRVGEAAIWMGACSEHRDAAFAGVARAMTEIKTTVPIWKRERYADGESAWVLCREQDHGRCHEQDHGDEQEHGRGHGPHPGPGQAHPAISS